MTLIILCPTIWINSKPAYAIIDRVVVYKSQRNIVLEADGKVVHQFKISLGENPLGHKEMEGDEKTPEGEYLLDWRNENSAFYKSIHISYPNTNDTELAQSKNVSPGGMIMIHGMPNYFGWAYFILQQLDWTNGCIAVSNTEMDVIWDSVKNGTPIEILP